MLEEPPLMISSWPLISNCMLLVWWRIGRSRGRKRYWTKVSCERRRGLRNLTLPGGVQPVVAHCLRSLHHKWMRKKGVRMTRLKQMTQIVKEIRGESPSQLSAEELRKIDAYWRACNYLAAGMIYLRENPLLREPL